jgi:hypothetical protein
MLSILWGFFLAVSLPAAAQINGVPASVTSLGFGGKSNPTPGVRASITSLGPNGLGNNWSFLGNCCSNFFLPSNRDHGLSMGRHHHRRDRDSVVGLVEPVYVPYAVPYAPESDDDLADDADDGSAPYSGPRILERPVKHPRGSDSVAKNADFSEREEPVAAQPSTMLVFKDGHKSDVLNYAIVGDTLFDFSADHTRKIRLTDLDLTATHKANDDRGVDFEIPASLALQ